MTPADKEVVKGLERRLEALEGKASMNVPNWAEAAVKAAIKAGIVDSADKGSYDFYRILTVIHRKGLI
ncbi:hypothetical protein D3C78_1829890 [compost metagenome]